MKKNYDIRLNPKPLSKEEIERHKNFDSLLTQFATQPKKDTIVKKLVWRAAAIAASLVGFFFLYNQVLKTGYSEKQAAFFEARPYINQPFEQIKPTFASFKVDPNEGGIYKYPSGSQLTVPAAAFVNEKGETLSGEVTLHYREMHDVVDFFMSGIPMTYDSAGVNYNLESAGMIEIFAEQDGKRINMAPGKTINVELVSNVNTSPSLAIPAGYNIYKLDEKNRNWVYQDIDRMEVISDEPVPSSNLDENSPFYPAQKTLAEKMLAIQVSEAAETNKLEKSIPKPKQPSKPQRAVNKDHVFSLDMNDIFPTNGTGIESEEAQELRQLYAKYSKMLWQLNPKSSITPDQLQKEFSLVTGLSIKKLNEQDYELSLEKKGTSIKVMVNPVLSGSDYERAMAEFNRDLENFTKLNTAREAKLAADRAAIAKRFEEEKRLATLNFEQRIEELRKQGNDYAANNEIIKKKVVNRFTASAFGIWNCDRPLPPQMLQLAANFVDEKGNPLRNKAAYLVDKSRNTVYQFLAEDGAELRFNKSSENLVWLVTEDNKIAVFRPQKFKDIDPKAKRFEFVMEAVNKEIKSEQDIREILYL
jgi:hypothetical protein